MKRHVLLVAVGKYGKYAEELHAPKYELGQWQQLLSTNPYKFDNVVPLLDPSLDTVTGKLEELLDGAGEKDELLFVAMCHGMLVASSTEGEDEQALVMNPAGVGLEAAALRESKVKEIFRKAKKGQRNALFIDACYSGDYADVMRRKQLAKVGVVGSAVPLFIPTRRDLSNRRVRAFGEFASSSTSDNYGKPVILAATDAKGLAYETTYDGIRRMAFTRRLLDALPQIHDTFANIHKKIEYVDEELSQVASLGGNAARWNEKFPYPIDDSAAVDEPSNESVESAPQTAMTQTPSLNLRVMGLACFINARGRIGAHKARIVLPYDNGEFIDDPSQKHCAWMEIATEDLVEAPTGPLVDRGRTYQRNGEQYTRWLLNGHTVSVETANFENPFTRSPRFLAHVPKLTEVAPELSTEPPDPMCFEEGPLLNRFAAFVNIASGYADVGSIDPREVRYKRSGGAVTLGPITTPRTVKVNIPILSDHPTIVLRSSLLGDERRLVVKLQPGATVLIANSREIDITGNGAGNVPAKQFRQYYKVAITEPDDPPLPSVPLIPSDDCTVTDYP